jgi:glycosyltransferase involved in cell wall biosynthesis
MGEFIRASFRGFQSVAAPVRVYDASAPEAGGDPDLQRELRPHLTDRLSPYLNIFHINGDEIAETLRRLHPPLPPTSYSIIWPMWELSRYPEEWAREVARFDEVWVASRHTEASLRAAVSNPISCMPLGIEPRLSRFLGRRYFGISETSFVFLFVFDFLSFIERKNPFAVLEAFRRLTRLRPGSDILLVIKLNNSSRRPMDHQRLMEAIAAIGDRVLIIDRSMSDDEIKNLIRCCDCFVSLHRAEGFGFSLGEAMYFRKPVIATAYSGNMEFMNEANSCLVPSKLVPVPEGSYPSTDGQVWAEPDTAAAVECMVKLSDNPLCGRSLGQAASRHVRTHFSYRSAGLRYMARVAEILSTTRPPRGKP